MRAACVLILIVGTGMSVTTRASPNVSLDDPVYDQLRRLYALDRLPAYLGGLRPLTEARLYRLFQRVGSPDVDRYKPPGAWWLVPLTRASLRVALFHEEPRAYSTDIRPRTLAGSVDVSCEHTEGRACGSGVGVWSELETSAGYKSLISANARVSAATGLDNYNSTLGIERAYLHSEVGPVAAELGRDVLVIGPSPRTQLAWGDHAAPLDHVRVSTSEPYALKSDVNINLLYAIGRLRDPQTFDGTLVTISRAQLDIGGHYEIGMEQLLQLGGDGATSLGVVDFVLEHIRRRDKSGGPTDSSNRRLGFDVAAHIDGFHGARLYYELVFEDLRKKRFIDAVRFDADHLVGLDIPALGGTRHGLVFEAHTTGVRSQEHGLRSTGFTNAGRVVGSPLGPDARSLFLRGRIDLAPYVVDPWIELVELRSDTYDFVEYGPITKLTRGVAERRARAGLHLRVVSSRDVRLDAEMLFEHVSASAFVPGRRHENAGLMATVVWEPRNVTKQPKRR